jgi:hypothetical protein
MKHIVLVFILLVTIKLHAQIEFYNDSTSKFAVSGSYSTVNNGFPDKFISGSVAYRLSAITSISLGTSIAPGMSHDNIAVAPSVIFQNAGSEGIGVALEIGFATTMGKQTKIGIPVSFGLFYRFDLTEKLQVFPEVEVGTILLLDTGRFIYGGGLGLGYKMIGGSKLILNASLALASNDYFMPSLGCGIVF